MLVRRILTMLALLGVSGTALAGFPVTPVPEPEVLSLLAIGAAAIVVARWLKKK